MLLSKGKLNTMLQHTFCSSSGSSWLHIFVIPGEVSIVPPLLQLMRLWTLTAGRRGREKKNLMWMMAFVGLVRLLSVQMEVLLQ